jgi:hypothetical protein
MKKIISSNLIAAAIISVFISGLSSCKKEPFQKENPVQASLAEGIRTANGRLVFKDNEAFYKTMEVLDKSNDETRVNFEKKPGFISFRNAINNVAEDHAYSVAETELMNMPPAIQLMLNSNGEVQVGNDIIWYNNGTKYYVPETDAAQLEKIKQNPDMAAAAKKSSYFLKFSKPKSNTGTSSGGIVPNWVYLSNSADARHQREFWQNSPAAGNRKYVHELGVYTDYYYVAPNTCGQATYSYYTGCYLYIKMEWRGRRWKPAGETREINYNINCSGSTSVARGCGIVDNFGFNVNPVANTTSNGTYTITMFTFSNLTVSNSGYYPIGWSVNVEGTIYQHVVGDVTSNEWYNTGYPLW